MARIMLAALTFVLACTAAAVAAAQPVGVHAVGAGGRSELRVTATGSGRAGAAFVSGFALDRGSARAEPAVEGTGRAHARADIAWAAQPDGPAFGAVAALDLAEGSLFGRPLGLADRAPGDRHGALLWNDAYVFARLGDRAGVRAGLQASAWGLGLVANDGRAELGLDRQTWFEQSRPGDRALRVLVHAMPWAGTASPLRGLVFVIAGDRVVEDDVLRSGDGAAAQAVGAVRLHLARERWVGLYAARRTQRHPSGRLIRATVLDLACDLDHRDVAGNGLRFEAEAAYVGGDTDLGPTPDFPTHSLAQVGALARTSWRSGALGLQVDLGYQSGDAQPDDGKLTAFRADRNLRQGLVLFERVIGWQTGRMPRTAVDPGLAARAPDDLDRLPSDGAISNAITLFPKLGWRFGDVWEAYGGALLAWAPAAPVDPYQTKVRGGGAPVNALGGAAQAGDRWGTEVDLGVRATWRLPDMWRSAFQVGIEGATLLPGPALQGPGEPMAAVHAGRFTLALVGTPTPIAAKADTAK
ncbi:MAG: hypothetical protein EXR79_17235 [Myxococcales bacterium]|nr:hypothetical protein [Myxococcales bacterium]